MPAPTDVVSLGQDGASEPPTPGVRGWGLVGGASPLPDEIADLNTHVREDSRWETLNDEWWRCMETSGIDEAGGDPDKVTESILGQIADIRREDVLIVQSDLTDEDHADLERLAEREQAVYAAADAAMTSTWWNDATTWWLPTRSTG